MFVSKYVHPSGFLLDNLCSLFFKLKKMHYTLSCHDLNTVLKNLCIPLQFLKTTTTTTAKQLYFKRNWCVHKLVLVIVYPLFLPQKHSVIHSFIFQLIVTPEFKDMLCAVERHHNDLRLAHLTGKAKDLV